MQNPHVYDLHLVCARLEQILVTNERELQDIVDVLDEVNRLHRFTRSLLNGYEANGELPQELKAQS